MSSRACVSMVGCTDCLRDGILHSMFLVEAKGEIYRLKAKGVELMRGMVEIFGHA